MTPVLDPAAAAGGVIIVGSDTRGDMAAYSLTKARLRGPDRLIAAS